MSLSHKELSDLSNLELALCAQFLSFLLDLQPVLWRQPYGARLGQPEGARWAATPRHSLPCVEGRLLQVRARLLAVCAGLLVG